MKAAHLTNQELAARISSDTRIPRYDEIVEAIRRSKDIEHQRELVDQLKNAPYNRRQARDITRGLPRRTRIQLGFGAWRHQALG